MSRLTQFALVAAFAAIVSFGCTSADSPVSKSDTDATSAAQGQDAAGKICGSCGDGKGTESCCSETAEKCECGMNKGSKLCCVELDESLAGKDLCGSCGNVAGDETCCAEDAEKCACGMAKGSALCCKLKSEES